MLFTGQSQNPFWTRPPIPYDALRQATRSLNRADISPKIETDIHRLGIVQALRQQSSVNVTEEHCLMVLLGKRTRTTHRPLQDKAPSACHCRRGRPLVHSTCNSLYVSNRSHDVST